MQRPGQQQACSCRRDAAGAVHAQCDVKAAGLCSAAAGAAATESHCFGRGAECSDRQHRGCPSRWQRGPRQIRLLQEGVRLLWRLPVEQLQQACRDSTAQQKNVEILSPRSALLGGVAWQMMVKCQQQEGGAVVGLFAGPVWTEVPAGIHHKFTCDVSWQGLQRTMSSPCIKRQFWGYPNYFQLQPMAGGGWDAAAWAAAGLPAAGEMLLELCMRSVM
uniref:Uncharacterized protein n=1 Tax=Tetradesmus obliquus TaxID=3088 RepID=A0A383VP16_TETOB|eukprot:jgi/Sobl393_1/17190/SZX66643.1